jgi:hypothetical protein
MNSSLKNKDDEFVKGFVEYFGESNIPNPEQYPRKFEFLVKSYEHYMRMREVKSRSLKEI